MNRLSMSVQPDGDGVWRIWADARAGPFAGRGWAWGGPEDIAAFAAELARFPLFADAPATLELGRGVMGDEARVAIHVAPINLRGDLEVKATLADPFHAGCLAKVRFLTAYAEVARFVPGLHRIAAGDRAEAVLEGR